MGKTTLAHIVVSWVALKPTLVLALTLQTQKIAITLDRFHIHTPILALALTFVLALTPLIGAASWIHSF